MSEIDYLKLNLKDKEKAFDKLHKLYIELLKKQGELEKENKSLQIEVLGQSEEIEILSDENKRLKQGLKQQCLDFMKMLDDMGIAYLLNDDLE